jgi:hypothetical protein
MQGRYLWPRLLLEPAPPPRLVERLPRTEEGGGLLAEVGGGVSEGEGEALQVVAVALGRREEEEEGAQGVTLVWLTLRLSGAAGGAGSGGRAALVRGGMGEWRK